MAKKSREIKMKNNTKITNNLSTIQKEPTKPKTTLLRNVSKNAFRNQRKKLKKKKKREQNNEEDEVLFNLPKIETLKSEIEIESKNNIACKKRKATSTSIGEPDDNSIDGLSISSVSDHESDSEAVVEQEEALNSEENVEIIDDDEVERRNIVENAKYITAERDSSAHGLILLKESVEVPITGMFSLEVIKGKINILGYQLNIGKDVPVFSSKRSGVLKLRDTSCQNTKLSMKHENQLKNLFKGNFADVLKDIEKFHSVAIITKLSPHLSYGISFASRIKSYKNIFPDPPMVHIEKSQALSVIETDIWNPVVSEVMKSFENSENFIALIRGNKNVGKSTFARFLVNSLLNCTKCVYFLECDVGQTEFTPPGIISLSCVREPLHGAPFTHQSTPAASFFFGHITTRNDPKTYINYIREAFDFYHNKCRNSGPLIINTQGWMKGLGFSLLIDVIRVTNPSLVLHLKTTTEAEKNSCELSQEIIQSQPGWICPANEPQTGNYDNESAEIANTESLQVMKSVNSETYENDENCSDASTRFLTVAAYEGPASGCSHLKAVDYRRLALLAYFGNLFIKNNRSSTQVMNIDRPLEYFVPLILHWKDIAVHVMHCKVAPSMIMRSLNFSVVSLAIVHPSNIIELSKELLPDGPKFLRGNSTAAHVGFGFVRNIDLSRKCFIIITPENESSLKEVNAVLKGAVDMPMGVFDQGSRPSAVYCTVGQQSVIRGSSARRPRFNLKRKKFDSPAKFTSSLVT